MIFRTLLIGAMLLAAFWPTALMAKVKVVATLPTLGAIAEEVGKDQVKVTVMASANQDPHYVDPRPNLVLMLNQADLLMVNGLELEDSWLEPLIVNARNPKVTRGQVGFFDASTQVNQKLEVPQGPIDRGQGDIHAGGNPHFLLSPIVVRDIALGFAKRLAQVDPQNQAIYAANAKDLAARLDALILAEQERFKALSPAKKQVVSYHQSLSYFYAFLGLKQVATVEPRPGIAPSPNRVATVLSTMKGTGATAIVQESFYPSQISETLVKLSGGNLALIPGGFDAQKHADLNDYFKISCDIVYGAL